MVELTVETRVVSWNFRNDHAVVNCPSMTPVGLVEWVLGLSLVGAVFVTPLAMFRDLFYNQRASVFGSVFWASVFGVALPGVGVAIYWYFRD
jgi:hypothetical protein